MHRKYISPIIIAVMALAATPVRAAPAVAADIATTTQLPRTVRPTHYDVALVPDAASLTFSGRVVIAIEVLEPTTAITLNAAGMSFEKVSLSGGLAGMEFAAPRVQVDESAQTATFGFDRPIAPGSYRLSLDYTGKIATQATGLFAIDYDSAAGPKRALYTQFENSDARRVIPSWDEPSYKATFSLEATIPGDAMTVSNMPIAQKTDLGSGRSLVRFETSPKMSTYLLFFALGDFDRATARVAGTELGVVTQKGLISQAMFALESSKLILREYNDYFAIPYPLPKLDDIAAPGGSQFFGAMENWGAIFTFEFAMLIDPSISTQIDTERAFAMAAHETSHQWFGDLVTMRWWDDLWLNEGFANWMEGRTTERLHPEWNTALLTVAARERAMGRDALATTHPIVQHIETVEQGNQAFDAITYNKGAAVIGMLEAYVGADAWRAGVRRYLKAHAYGNTVSEDLWKEIEAVAGKPISGIAHDFTLQPGVPMIRVEDAVCSAGRTKLRLTQGEFSKDQPDKAPLAWRVPVTVRPLGAAAPVRRLLTGGKATVTLPGCAPAIVNAGQKGYYRTLYAPRQFAGIAQSFAAVAPIDQLGILSDSWALGLAGLQPATDFFDLAKATPTTADRQVWGRIASVFDGINDYYDGESARQAAFRQFAIGRLAPVFAQVGWAARPGELSETAILRNHLIDTLSALGDPAVIAEARRRYAVQAGDPAAVPAPLRKTILAVVARHADTEMWYQLRAAARAEKTPLIKTEFYLLLASTEDEGLAARALELALTPEPGATTTAAMFASVAALHADLAFDFGIAHLTAVMEKVDTPSRSRFFARIAGRSHEPAMIDKINAYALANLAAGSRRDADTAAADIAYRIKVRSERLPAIDAWLARN